MSGLTTLWGRQPAMILALVQAAIVLAVSFGLHLAPEQTGAILAVVAIILGLATKSQSTPVASPILPWGTAVTTPEGAAAAVTLVAGPSAPTPAPVPAP